MDGDDVHSSPSELTDALSPTWDIPRGPVQPSALGGAGLIWAHTTLPSRPYIGTFFLLLQNLTAALKFLPFRGLSHVPLSFQRLHFLTVISFFTSPSISHV